MDIDFETEFAEEFHDGLDDQYDNDVIARLKKASQAIKTKRTRFTSEDVDDFFLEHGAISGVSPSKDAGNLLHSLVDVVKHNEINPEHVELLLRRLVERYPDLLKYPNKDGHNPIFMAIRACQHQLVDYMVSSCLKDKSVAIYQECLDDVLSKKVQDGKTCLHAALTEKGFNSNTAKMLIESASDDVLAVLDDHNKTAMHYAVQFPKCTEERMELIELFIRRDLEAVQSQSERRETFLDLPRSNGSSVYQEHQKSRDSTLTWWKNHGQARESAKRDQTNSGSADTQAVRDLKPLTSSRDSKDPRHVVVVRMDKAGRDLDPYEGLDARERLRQMKKDEEAAAEAAKRGDTAGGKRDWIRERERRPDRPERTASRGGSRDRRSNQVDENLRLVTRSTGRPTDPEPNTPVKRSNVADVDGKFGQSKLEPPERPKPVASKSTDTASIMRALTKNSDDMLLKLKLHYMRTRNPEMVISFLYGTNMNDIQISFDYDCLPQEIVWSEFEQRLSGFKFDRVLQYVTFPHVEVRQKGRKADLERAAEEKTGIRQLGALGRKDMKFFLKWLFDKGVRHIINLSVEDSGERSGKVHSDQAIQSSLEKFVIEQLDWRKTDLDPETILHVGSKAGEHTTSIAEGDSETEAVPDRRLRHLYLSWSGSNAVLRAWSEPEGLPLLPQLQRIYLIKPPFEKTYDNVKWIGKKVSEFQSRFNASRKLVRERELDGIKEHNSITEGPLFGDVEVIPTESNSTHDSELSSHAGQHFTTSSHAKAVDSHKWLDSTAGFASEMSGFWYTVKEDFLRPRQNVGTPEQIESDVVVALIDDGIDMFDTDLSNQVLEGKSFDFHGVKMRPPFSSAKGHGTVMASMILRVCPMAKLYPIRLKTYDSENGKSSIDPEYAAQAIQAALDKKATIISMSWTLPMSKGKSDAKDRLHSVLQKAVDKKVLMICSAPDEGKFTELDYPSGPWRERFFRIGAAHADGTVFRWTPDDGITYVLPGVDVVKDQVGRSYKSTGAIGITKRVTDFEYETGSSVATALAAGLAAMIIYCVKASILAVKTANQNKGRVVGLAFQDNGADLIADPDAMKRAFATLGKVTPTNFIQVWEELDKAAEILKNWRERSSSSDAKQECIDRFVEFGHKLANSVSGGTF